MGQKLVPPDRPNTFIGNFDEKRFSITYPNLYPAISEVYRHYAGSEWVHHVNTVLIGFCLLFEGSTRPDDGRELGDSETIPQIKAMLAADHRYLNQKSGTSFRLNEIYGKAIEMLGDKAVLFQRAIAKMYSRLRAN